MRSPEEIKKGLKYCSEKAEKKTKCSECIYFNDPRGWCSTAITKDALAYIQQLEAKQPRWISVGERLPELDQEVLLIAHGWEGRLLYIGCLHHVDGEKSWLTGIESMRSDWLIEGWSYLKTPLVTHWMPLPLPPEEE